MFLGSSRGIQQCINTGYLIFYFDSRKLLKLTLAAQYLFSRGTHSRRVVIFVPGSCREVCRA